MPKRIAITGGKGGTGKSTVATALASRLGKDKRVLLVDADVDCPDDHLILSREREKVKDILGLIPKFDLEKCKKCGKCARVCKEGAIVSLPDKYPTFISQRCTGCGACMVACPTGAISKGKQKIGTIWRSKDEKKNVDLITGELSPGFEEASPIVNALKEHADKIEEDYDYILIDTAAGAHCDVIAAFLGVDMALAVTEPTPLGEHDLSLILDLMAVLDIKGRVVLNKSDIGNSEGIEKIVRSAGVRLIAKIPYKKKIEKAYSSGKPIQGEEIRKLARVLEEADE